MTEATLTSYIKMMDAFPKVEVTYLRQTRTGGLATLIGYVLMVTLMVAELMHYLIPRSLQHYQVDHTIYTSVLINFDISVATECEKLLILVTDESGSTEVVNHRVDSSPEYFGSTSPNSRKYWGETIGDLVSQSEEHMDPGLIYTGCRLQGSFPINKTNGRLLIMPVLNVLGAAGKMLTSLDPTINFSHHIRHLSFGIDYPGMKNPLDGTNQLSLESHERFNYFLSVIPTQYKDKLSNVLIETNQYSLMGLRGRRGEALNENAGLVFHYELQPLALVIMRDRIPFLSFLVHIVGILGGVYTCSGLIHHIVNWAYGQVRRFCGISSGIRKQSGRITAGWSPVASFSEGSGAIVKTALISGEGDRESETEKGENYHLLDA